MPLLLTTIRPPTLRASGIQDRVTAGAVGNLEAWATELVRQLSKLDVSAGGALVGGVSSVTAGTNMTVTPTTGAVVVSLNNSVSLSGTLSVTGAVDFASTLQVDGNATIGSGSANAHTVNGFLAVTRGTSGAFLQSGTTLDVEDDAANYISVRSPADTQKGILFGNPSGGQDGGIIYDDPAYPRGMVFRTGNGERALIDSAGYMGVGITAPTAQLHVRQATTGDDEGLFVENTSTLNDSAALLVHNASPTGGAIAIRNTNAAGPVDFYAVDHLNTPKMSWGWGNSSYSDLERRSRGYVWRNTGVDFVFARTNITDTLLTSDGRWGIGTETPDTNSKVHLQSGTGGTASLAGSLLTAESSGVTYITIKGPATNNKALLFSNPSGNADGSVNYDHSSFPRGMAFNTAGTSRLFIFSSGNVRIGSTATDPGVTLRVDGALTTTGNSILGDAGSDAHTANGTLKVITGTATGVSDFGIANFESAGNTYVSMKAAATFESGLLFNNTTGIADGGLVYTNARTLQLRAAGNTTRLEATTLGVSVTGALSVSGDVTLGDSTSDSHTVNGKLTGIEATSTTFGTLGTDHSFVARDSTSMAVGVGGALLFEGNYTGTTQTGAGLIKAAKTNGTDGNWSFDLVFGTRANGSSVITEALRLHDTQAATFASYVGAGTSADSNVQVRVSTATARQYGVYATNNPSAATASRLGCAAEVGGTYNTTAGAINSYGLYGAVTSTRSAGANSLVNIGGFLSASGGQTNIGLYVAEGDSWHNVTSGSLTAFRSVTLNSSAGTTTIQGATTINNTLTTTGNCTFGDSTSADSHTANGKLLVNGGGYPAGTAILTAQGSTALGFGSSDYITINLGPQVHTGTGSPESSVTAPVGSLYLRTDGGANTTLYVKESGSGNTGWVAK